MTTILDRPSAPTVSAAPIDYLARAQGLQSFVRAEAKPADDLRELPAPIADRLRAEGLFRMVVPRRWGGAELTLPEVMRILETLAAADLSVAWNTMVSCALPAAAAAFLDDASGIEALGGAQTATSISVARPGMARAVEGGYRVTARWGFVSGFAQSSWVGGLCLVYDGDTLRTGPDGKPAAIVTVVRSADTTAVDNWNTLGLRGTGSTDVTVDDLFVPTSFVVDFQSPRTDVAPIYLFDENIPGPCCAAAMVVGAARTAIDEFVAMAREKRGSDGQLLAEKPHARCAVADAEIAWRQARSAIYSVAEDICGRADRGEMPGAADVNLAQLTAIGAIQAGKAAITAVFTAAGTSAIVKGSFIERAFRDVHTLAAHIMIQESNLDRLGGALLS